MTQGTTISDPDTVLYTVQEVAEILKVGPRTVYRYINEGQLESVRLSARKTRVRRRDLLGFLERARGQAV
jgi:excisionase family DNA binding protein